MLSLFDGLCLCPSGREGRRKSNVGVKISAFIAITILNKMEFLKMLPI